jgi:hypothetical protein
MARWSQKTVDVITDAFVMPAINSDWYNTGAWGTYVGLNPHQLGKKIARGVAYNLRIDIYAPEVRFGLSPGELEKIPLEIEKVIDNYVYQLGHAELVGKNYRWMFTGTLIAYIIAAITANGWWFIFF